MTTGDAMQHLAELAELAAAADTKEGGTRVGRNVLAMLSWAATFKLEHQGCGPLVIERGPKGITAVVCPVHGRSEAPAWEGPDAP